MPNRVKWMVPKRNWVRADLLQSAGQVLQLLQGCVTSWTVLLCTASDIQCFWQILHRSAQMWIFANINTKMSQLPTLILNISVANSHNFPWAPKISKVVLSVWCLLINCKLTGLAHLHTKLYRRLVPPQLPAERRRRHCRGGLNSLYRTYRASTMVVFGDFLSKKYLRQFLI